MHWSRIEEIRIQVSDLLASEGANISCSRQKKWHLCCSILSMNALVSCPIKHGNLLVIIQKIFLKINRIFERMGFWRDYKFCDVYLPLDCGCAILLVKRTQINSSQNTMEEHDSLTATVTFISEWTKGGFIGFLQKREKENKKLNSWIVPVNRTETSPMQPKALCS